MSLIRQFVSLALAVALTLWILEGAPAPDMKVSAAEAPPAPASAPSRLQPITEAAVPVQTVEAPPVEVAQESEPQAEPAPELDEPSGSAPAAPELGSRDGDESAESPDVASSRESPSTETPSEPADDPQDVADAATPARPSAADLSADEELNEAAARELSGAEAALGFSTVLLSSPEDQLDIARAFGERVVLVPKAAFTDDPEARSFELSFQGRRDPRVVSMPGRPDLEHSRQYRDLFAYDFQRLSPKLRELRRSVIRRDEVFLFAALIPASEWAIVIGRRREACAAASVDPDEVERYVLRYVRDGRGGFDFLVEELELASGQVIRPPAPPRR